MIPKDNAFTNATLADHLLARKCISGPLIQGQTIRVSENLILGEHATITNENSSLGAVVLTTGDQSITGVKTFLDPIVLSGGIQLDVNQLDLGVGHKLTLRVPTLSISRTYSLADIGQDASFVMTKGDQTIEGVKTFSETPIFSNGLSFPSLNLSATTNQIILGTDDKTITLHVPTPAAARLYMLPDVLSDANFVMTAGAQSVGGAKTFSNATITFPTSGGTPTALSYYELYTGTLDFTSPAFTGTKSPPVTILRIGNAVTLNIDSFSGTGTNNPGKVTSIAIPSRFRPFVAKSFVASVFENTVNVSGRLSVATSGVITISSSIVSSGLLNIDSNFTGVGQVVVEACAIHWVI